MATLKNYYNTGDDVDGEAIGASTYWKAQTWTATSSYTAESIRLKLYRDSGLSTTTLTISLKNTDVNAKPTGSDLASVTLSTDSITTTNAGTWYSFTLSSPVSIVSGNKYAIVARITTATGGFVRWKADNGAGYSGGSDFDSANGGSTWTADTSDDSMFEIYSTVIPVDKVYSKKLVAIGNNEVWYETAAGTMAELSAASGNLDTGSSLMAVESYEKIFITNNLNKKVIDFVNTKLNTTDAGLQPCTSGMILTGGTSTASMIVDYVNGVTDNSTMNVYGKRTTVTAFSSGETVTGTNSVGNTVSFVTSAAETAPPHWYNWTVFGQVAATYGTLLIQPTLICLYRGRLVISGDYTLPHAWQMTKVGNPWKVLYDFTNDGDISAVTYTNAKVGLIGDIITALIPYKDDLLIFGCANSLWILIGDPLAEGQLAEITHNTGIWGPTSWCIDNKKSLYFMGVDGIYQMTVSETSSPPVNISKSRLPQLMTTLDLDKSLHRVVLSYDPVENGIIISKTLLSDGTNTNYFFSLITNGFFPESYPASCGIFSSYYYPATDETYKKFLVGCTDGYIREFDGATKNDTTTASTDAIGSYCTVLQQLGPDENTKGMLNRFSGIVAGGASSGDFSDTDGVSFELHKGDDAETVLEDIKDGATAFTSGTWSTTGKQNSVRPRLKGYWAGIKLYNSTASQTWAVEKLYGDVLPKGNV